LGVRKSVFFLLIALSSTANATEYFMGKTNANDSNPGTSMSAPWATLSSSVSKLKAGDILHILGGTYTQGINSNSTKVPSGTASSPITIKAYNRVTEPVVFNGGGEGILNLAHSTLNPKIEYLIFDGLILDGVNLNKPTDPTNGGGQTTISIWGNVQHIRIQNCELKNSPAQGITVFMGGGIDADFNELINNKIHDNGSNDFDHGIYINTNNNLIEGNEFYRNSGWGIHKYSKGNNNIIRNNKLYNNARLGLRGPGIGVYGGTGNLIYNNLIWGNNYGIAIDYREAGTKVFNNTIVNNRNYCIQAGTGAVNPIIRNNICWNNQFAGFALYVPITQGTNFLTDPKFMNLTSFDFRLQSTSQAIEYGENLSEVPRDFLGVSRPQGLNPLTAKHDAGAYEYNFGSTPTAAPAQVKNLRVVQ
jgi:parallel beta-helix repeat protein